MEGLVEIRTAVYVMAFIGGAACGAVTLFLAMLFAREAEE